MSRRLKLWRSRLCADQQGVAAVEFALYGSLILVLMLIGLDLGIQFTQKLRVNAAVSEGTTYAFNMRSNNSVTTTMIKNYVATAAQTSTPPNVVITCNGQAETSTTCTTRPRVCACITGGTPGAPVFGSAVACNTACGDGTTAGHYLTVSATLPIASIIVPNRFLPPSITETATVRLR